MQNAGASGSRNEGNGTTSVSAEETSSAITEVTAPTALRKLVLNYLVHHCYIDTAQALVDDGGSGSGSGGILSPRMATSEGVPNGKKAATSSQDNAVSSSSPSLRRNGAASSSQRGAHSHSLAGGSSSSTYAHPLAAPPLSREDSSMDVEVDSSLSIKGVGGAGIAATSTEEAAQMNASSQTEDELSFEELNTVRIRKEIRDSILTGRITRAIELLQHHFPTVLPPPSGAASSDDVSSMSNFGPLSHAPSEANVERGKTAPQHNEGVGVQRILPSNPTSLDPLHLWLNLHIQSFIETMRGASTKSASMSMSHNGSSMLMPAQAHQSASAMPSMHSLVTSTPGIAAAAISRSASPAPSSASSSASVTSGNGMSGSMHSASGHGAGASHAVSSTVQGALAHAQWLFVECQKLPKFWRAMYLKELESVSAILAYRDLAKSPQHVHKYLDQSRREALSEQINSAIVFRSGKPSQPLIESAVRQTAFCWSALHLEMIGVPENHAIFSSGLATDVAGIDASNGAVSSASAAGQGAAPTGGQTTKNKGKLFPPWDLHSFLQR